MNKLIGIAIVVLMLLPGVVSAEELSMKVGGRAWDIDSISNVRSFLLENAEVLHLKDVGATKSFIVLNGRYFLLYDNYTIRGVDYSNKKFLGQWAFDVNPMIDYESLMNNSWEEQESAGVFNDSVEYYGCLSQYPMLAADVNHDGEDEILILNESAYALDLNVFSQEKRKIVFASNVYVDMAFVPDEDMKEERGLADKSQDPQYLYLVDGYVNAYNDGYRSFGKLFFGDINADGKQDIILWRKYFESLKQGDAKKGFAKKDELFVHYSLVDGDYKKQPTDAKTIKGWLAAKQLSWQQGFPSRSECPGQEGQLIPELHDPLLNDPDVLH